MSYCDFSNNDLGPFVGGGPLAIGELITTNANGDSADTYYNIFRNPMFADTGSGDYHLTAGSPCIDAGDPNLANDPDGTVADIGAYYFSQLEANPREQILPKEFVLEQNYPNPFNPTTEIRFELAKTGRVTLKVYNIMGQEVASLTDGILAAGMHEIVFDAKDLASGIYVYRLEARNFSESKKMVVMK